MVAPLPRKRGFPRGPGHRPQARRLVQGYGPSRCGHHLAGPPGIQSLPGLHTWRVHRRHDPLRPGWRLRPVRSNRKRRADRPGNAMAGLRRPSRGCCGAQHVSREHPFRWWLHGFGWHEARMGVRREPPHRRWDAPRGRQAESGLHMFSRCSEILTVVRGRKSRAHTDASVGHRGAATAGIATRRKAPSSSAARQAAHFLHFAVW